MRLIDVAVVATFVVFLAVFAGATQAGTVGDPFTGTPIQINGTPGAATIWEAENFDKGGEGVAYHDPHACSAPPVGTSCSCPPGAYRPDGVNVCVAGAVTHISYDDAGLWVNYTVWVNASAAYTVELLAANDGACTTCAATYYIEADGWRYPQDVTKSYAILPTGGWQVYAWQAKSDPISLSPGKHTLSIRVTHGWFNWDSVRVKYAQDATVIWDGFNWVPVLRAFP
jgi:hypothetical protein